MVTMWDMFTFFSASAALVSGYHAAKLEHGGALGYLVGITLGSVIGVGATLAVRRLGRLWVRRTGGKDAPYVAARMMALYVATLAWAVGSGFFGFFATRFAIGLLP